MDGWMLFGKGKPREMIHFTSETHLEYCVKFWALQYMKHVDILEQVLAKMVKGLEYLSCGKAEKDGDFFTVEMGSRVSY